MLPTQHFSLHAPVACELGEPTKAAHSSSPAALLASVPAPDSGCFRPSGSSVRVPVCSTCSLASRAARTAVQPSCLFACLPSLESQESSLVMCTHQVAFREAGDGEHAHAIQVTWPGAVFPGRMRTWLCNGEWRQTAHCSWLGSGKLAARLLHVAQVPKLHTATERLPPRACHNPRTPH